MVSGRRSVGDGDRSIGRATKEEYVSKSVMAAAGMLVFLAAGSLPAQIDPIADRCEGSGAAIVDDGSFESGITCLGNPCHGAQKLTPAVYPSLLTRACFCWERVNDPALDFTIEIHDDDGPDGKPGTLLATKPVTIPGGPFPGRQMRGYACADLGVEVESGGLFVGAKYETYNEVTGNGLFLCYDDSPATPPAAAFRTTHGEWEGIGSGFKAFGIRALFEADDTGCVPSEHALCLFDGRFRVTVQWENFEHLRGDAHAQTLTDESGLFWFFSPQNIEFLVKIVNACDPFDRFWVFAAATTNVGYTMTVVDTVGHQTRVYQNVLGVSSPAIIDGDAFATCDAVPAP